MSLEFGILNSFVIENSIKIKAKNLGNLRHEARDRAIRVRAPSLQASCCIAFAATTTMA
jgi:hypothetical protein